MITHKITIKGTAETNHPYPERCVEYGDDTEFAEYIDNGPIANVVSGGYLEFEFTDGKLWSVVEYKSTRELNEFELKWLRDYTQGQWSDGIGEGFEQEPVTYYKDKEIYISPWYHDQEIKVEQAGLAQMD
jgi:hypothetical protein